MLRFSEWPTHGSRTCATTSAQMAPWRTFRRGPVLSCSTRERSWAGCPACHRPIYNPPTYLVGGALADVAASARSRHSSCRMAPSSGAVPIVVRAAAYQAGKVRFGTNVFRRSVRWHAGTRTWRFTIGPFLSAQAAHESRRRHRFSEPSGSGPVQPLERGGLTRRCTGLASLAGELCR